MNDLASGIYWIASYPKSGNTWVRVFINNLYQVMQYGLDADAVDINDLQNLTGWDIGTKLYEQMIGKPIDECGQAEIAEARPKVQQHIVRNNPGILPVKTHNALAAVNGHPTVNLGITVGAVYIVRDPRDVAVSFAHHRRQTIDQTIGVMSTPGYHGQSNSQSVGEYYGSWSENVSSWTKTENQALLVIRYEDMVAAPQTEFRKIADHLRQFPKEDELNQAINLSSFDSLRAQEDQKGFREKPSEDRKSFRKGVVSDWRNHLSASQAESIKVINREMMEKFGYLDN